MTPHSGSPVPSPGQQPASPDPAAAVHRPDLFALLEAVTDLVMVVVKDRIVYLNRAGVALLGHADAGAVIGKPLDSVLDPRALHEPLRRKQDSGRPERERWVRVPLKRAGGAPIDTDVLPVLMGDPSALAIVGRPVDFAAILGADAPAAALHAAEGLKQLIANMAHELRTPLNAIIGFSEIIASRMFGDINDRYAAYASDIEASGQHLLRIINDILDYAKVESGETLLRLEKAAVNEIIRAGLRLVATHAERNGVEIVDELADVLPLVNVDQTKVKQIIVNLVTNAIKFTPRGGQVRVGSRAVDSKVVEVWVRDNGVGMTEEEAAEALLPFRQPKRPPDGSFAGTGLGLPIAKALVALHRGEFRITSAPNSGTEVRFTLSSQDLEGSPFGGRP